MQDPWRVLGVPRDADISEIRAAWKRIARQTHPDRNPGDPEAEQRFKDAAAAWSLLSDPRSLERLRQSWTTPYPSAAPSELRRYADQVRRAVDDVAEILFRRVLPSYVAHFDRGISAELCWRLLRDIDELTLLDLPRADGQPGFGARGRANELIQRLRLRLDLRTRYHLDGRPRVAELTLVEEHDLRWASITIWIGALHELELRDDNDLRVVLLPEIAREVVRAIESSLPARLQALTWRDLTGNEGFPEPFQAARIADNRDLLRRGGRLAAGALGVLLVGSILWWLWSWW